MRTLMTTLALFACMTFTASAQNAAATSEEPLTVEQRLESLEAKIDLLLKRLGDPSGKSSLADYVEREFRSLKQDIKSNSDDLRRVSSDIDSAGIRLSSSPTTTP